MRKKPGSRPINDPDDAEAIQAKITKYFDSLEPEEDGKPKPPTFSGLALALGYSTRQQLWEHGRRDEAISIPIKRAMLMIDKYNEEQLSRPQCTGAIFSLKCRGWDDKPASEDPRDNEVRIVFDYQRK